MLQVQDYLKQNSLEALKENYGISYKLHDSLPLVILDYSQIDSPKTHPIVLECRGLCLELYTWKIVSKGFNRFFNVGEALEITNDFNWDNFSASTKEDGSYIHLFNYNGEWLVKTRNSFADGKLEGTNLSWKELFLSTIDLNKWNEMVPTHFVGIFELCSVYNKIVRHYKEPVSYLLAVYNRNTNDLFIDELEDYHPTLPQKFHFNGLEEVQSFIKEKEKDDKTYEGLVLTDSNGLKLKIKSSAYLALHRLRGNGNVFLDKVLLPLILTGELEEVLCYYPEAKENIEKLQERVNEQFSNLIFYYRLSQGIEDQKEFALKIQKCKFNSILFTLRKKYGVNYSVDKLKEIWEDSEKLIEKVLEL